MDDSLSLAASDGEELSGLYHNQHWFTELSRLFSSAPWPIHLRRDLLSQGNKTIWHPPAQSMGATFLASQWEPSDLPESVLNTISQARALSTRYLYALKWCLLRLVYYPRHRHSFMWHIVDIVLPARAVGEGSLPFHAQGLCSRYSRLTHSYR